MSKAHLRTYRFHGLDLNVHCSAIMAESLDKRFRLLPAEGEYRGTISLDFQSVSDPSQHRVKKPQGRGRAFYEFPSGEACYFELGDHVYLSFGDGVRALSSPGLGSASFSTLEAEPENLFMASHLMLTILLVEIWKRRGCYSVHAAGFSKDGKAILIPGTSGAGKSTIAITLLRSGFGYLSEDMVFLRRCSDGLGILGFPEDVDVSDRTIGFFPELDFLRTSPQSVAWAKRPVRADEVYGVEMVREARPGAIVLPHISGKEKSVVRPIGADEALLEMVSNVLLTEKRSCQSHLDILTELVRQTPCYRLETGRDFERIPLLFRELLSVSREEIHV
ncbi:MAG: hypothetical protein ABSA57_20300 [Candidatus Acidiferrales bacterium]|jgi:hypothetical protein